MGEDKRKLLLGGESLLERALRTLRGVSDRVIVCADGEEGVPGGCEVLLDEFPGSGPVKPIAAALSLAGEPCVVLACDLPFVDGRLLVALAERLDDFDAVMPRWEGGVEPTVSAFSPRAVPLLERAFARGEGISAVVRAGDVRLVNAETLTDEPARAFLNVNTPSDYARAKRLLGAEG